LAAGHVAEPDVVDFGDNSAVAVDAVDFDGNVDAPLVCDTNVRVPKVVF